MMIVNSFSFQEIQTLQEMHKNDPSVNPRIRAHAILLSHAGFQLSMIARVYSVCRQTVLTWIHAWDGGVCELLDKPRSGRPRILCEEAEVDVLARINQSPHSLKMILSELTESLDLTPGLTTLKRTCKRAGLSWKRIRESLNRESLKFKCDPDLFEQFRQQLTALIEQFQKKPIDLFYFDESGFTLEHCVLYAWQPLGETIEVSSSKSKRLYVLGCVNRECALTSVVVEGSVTSAVVIASIDHFVTTIQRSTQLIFDNAPVHTSYEFQENIEHWKKQGLTIIPIAPYSPELNIIEILWRKIKYEWMLFSAFESFQKLKESLFDFLANIGKSYNINFSQNV